METALKLVWKDKSLQFALKGQTLKIGRNSQNDVQIPDQLVSGKHAIIRDCQLIDQGSTNGTFVNEVEVPKNVPWPLKVGDMVTFGDTKLFVEVGQPYRTGDDEDIVGSDDDTAHSGPLDSSLKQATADDALVTSQPKPVSKGGPDWLASAPTVNGSYSSENMPSDEMTQNATLARKLSPADELVASGPSSNANGVRADDTQHKLFVLQKQVEALRADNLKLKQKLNPQRLRLQRRQEMEKEREYLTKLTNLEHQLFYGEEVEKAFSAKYGDAVQKLDETKRHVAGLEQRNEELQRETVALHAELKVAQKNPVSSVHLQEITTELRVLGGSVHRLSVSFVFLLSLVAMFVVFFAAYSSSSPQHHLSRDL